MPITFGSIGDIISVCLIVKDLVDALDKCRGSASEYQEIIRELRCLDRSLLEVEKLSRELDISAELNALCVTAKQTVDKCRSSVDGFLEKIRKYEKYLKEDGSGNVVKDSAMKMKWQMFRSSELAKFRVEVIAHYSSINALIASAQLNRLELNDTKLNERLSNSEQRDTATAERQEAILTDIRDRVEENHLQVVAGNTKLGQIADSLRFRWLRDIGGELRSLMQKTFLMNVVIYRAVLSIQGSLLGNLERTLIQEPFILEDAIGRLCPVHLQFICSWEAFEDVLEHRFRGLQGHNMVLQRAWIIQELATCRDISRKTPWTAAFLPGQKVGMDLVFWKQDVTNGTTTCPSCKAPSTSGYDRGVKCASCGLHYHSITEEPDNPGNRHSSREDFPDYQMMMESTDSKKRKFEDLAVGDEEMSHFKRVRVIRKKIKNDAEEDMKPLPNRVLDVQMTSSTYDTVRLYLTSNSPGHYACLSYVWGDISSVIKTTSTSIDEHCKGILVSDLPITIRDAISAVRNLGLRFLWVDSLCIIHDDHLDREREVKQMGNIYRNSSITLSATKFSDERRAWLFSDSSFKQPGVDISSIPVLTDELRPSRYRPHKWESRGWTFQEEMLSPRIQYLYPQL